MPPPRAPVSVRIARCPNLSHGDTLGAMSDSDRRPRLDRREFLRGTAAASLGIGSVGLPALEAFATAQEPSVKRYVQLGKTGLRISDISIGTGGTADASLIDYAFERGIRYFDTADGYPMGKPGRAEKAVGQALAGKRDKVVLTSKTVTKAKTTRLAMMKRLHASLRRLRTDYVDIYLNHGVNDVAVLKNPEWFEFAERAKKQGKIRFTGMSGHGGHLISCLDAALDEDLVDVILCAHNYGQDPAFYEKFTKSFDLVAIQVGLPRVLEKAHRKGVGVLVMKTLMGARLNDMKPYERPGSTYSQAAFRWVLSNPNIDGLVVSMKSREQVDDFLAASGQGAVRESDLELLRTYSEKNSKTYCRPGCDACTASCPDTVQIADVLRARMYAEDYGDVDAGRATYGELDRDASACLRCSDQRCASACPYGLEIPDLTTSAARSLGRA